MAIASFTFSTAASTSASTSISPPKPNSVIEYLASSTISSTDKSSISGRTSSIFSTAGASVARVAVVDIAQLSNQITGKTDHLQLQMLRLHNAGTMERTRFLNSPLRPFRGPWTWSKDCRSAWRNRRRLYRHTFHAHAL